MSVQGEIIVPFVVVGGSGVAKISAGSLPWNVAHLRMVVIAGGPAYLYVGREFGTTAEATADAASAAPAWKVSANSFQEGTLPFHWNAGTDAFMSIYCAGGGQGYLHFERCQCAREDKIQQALDAIATKRVI